MVSREVVVVGQIPLRGLSHHGKTQIVCVAGSVIKGTASIQSGSFRCAQSTRLTVCLQHSQIILAVRMSRNLYFPNPC